MDDLEEVEAPPTFDKQNTFKFINRWAHSKFAINKKKSLQAAQVKLDRNLYLDFGEKVKPRGTSTRASKLNETLRSKHLLHRGGDTVVKLPKLPFGKHRSYNNGVLFR